MRPARPLSFIVLLGVVSLFADMTYEGARSATGPFLAMLGASALAVAGSWPIAAALILVERAGKALRTPSRDAMLSYATAHTGRGWGFGLHEALDQVGATLGPLVVTAVVVQGGDYRRGFALLLVPALAALGT